MIFFGDNSTFLSLQSGHKLESMPMDTKVGIGATLEFYAKLPLKSLVSTIQNFGTVCLFIYIYRSIIYIYILILLAFI